MWLHIDKHETCTLLPYRDATLLLDNVEILWAPMDMNETSTMLPYRHASLFRVVVEK